jgi:PAS domain S-box-containing protein
MSSDPHYTILGSLADGRGTRLYRAVRSADRRPVILKVLDSQGGQARDLECLKHEYEIGKILDSRFVVKPLALDTYQGRPSLVLEDSGGVSLDQLLGAPMEIARFLRLAIAVAAAAAEIHRQEVIHKDLKPRNILVNPGNDEVKITDFGVASRLPREHRSARPPLLIEGSLPYLSPEQTGRTNRTLDNRTDLYSLGVTFHEMLTGRLPFEASDPVEWIHCHVALAPPSPTEIVPEVPEMLARIVLKLLAKMPEDRYQSARGLQLDLERCLEQWSARGEIEPFAPGERDTPDRLQIPQKLHGREAEIALLLQAFSRVVAAGTPELLLVSGYSGIGKSTLVQELYKPVVRERAFFLSGKFDQYKRDIPYATIAQAFRELVLEILAESEPRIAVWRQRLLGALGVNGQLLVDLIPPLELVLGRQPPVAELPPTEAQNRFLLVLRQFIGVIAQKDHPLALFLDDLQWADPASLGLLEELVCHPETRHLLIVGAYRDNEVTPTHPLMRRLDEVRKAGARVSSIVLGPLAPEHLAALVSEALRCRVEEARPLADLVHEKTAGNPFFAIQFLTALDEERLIELDPRTGAFRWDVAKIRAKAFTDNVVDLMIGKLQRLPEATKTALKQLACLGHSAEIALLTMVHGVPEEETHADLREVARAGLILRVDGRYTFLHDRVQEAAYSLIPEGERAAVHLGIGRLLLAHTAPSQLDEKVFEIVNQLDRGIMLIRSREERERAAELNLIAGKRARASTAYDSALKYLSAGSALLEQNSWDLRYELTFALELYRAECEYLTADLSAAEAHLAMLSRRARSRADAAAVTCVRVALYTTLDRSDRGVEACLDYLRRIGAAWSPHPTDGEVRKELERMRRQLGGRSAGDLVSLPPMTDRDCRATMAVLTDTISPALFTDENLLCLVIAHMVNLSLEHGNDDASCFAYVMLGLVLGPHFGDYQAAFGFGKLGVDLVEQRGLDRFKARVYLNFGHSVNPWTRHVRTSLDFLRRGFDAAQETGDLAFAAYNCSTAIVIRLAAGDPLADVQREAECALELTQKARFGLVVDTIVGQLRLVRALRGLTPDFSSFTDAEFDEDRFEHHFEENPRLVMAACWYWIRKLQARFHAGDHASAINAASRAEPLLWTSPSFFVVAEYHFYGALARAAHHDTAPARERPRLLEALFAHRKQLEVWNESCPENFENRVALVGAEIARIQGRDLDAMHLYEEAIRSARDNGFVHNEAVAHETAARFYRLRGFDRFADTYLREARSCYVRWGAEGKVQSLDRRHPELVERPLGAAASTFVGTPEQLDLLSLVKALQSISSEIVLPKLGETLLQIMLQQAGGQRGVLILVRDGELAVQAEATTHGKEIRVQSLHGVPASTATLPMSILHYVARTREPVILNDAAASARFASDEHFVHGRPRSLLCLPIVRQGRASGLVYLENNLATGAFTVDTIHMLELLGAQAAISLDNATLYTELERSQRELAAVLDNMVDGVFVVDRTGQLTLANQAAARLTGTPSPADMVGPLVDLARRVRFDHPDGTPYAAEQIPILRALGGETVALDEGMISLSGAERKCYLHTSASPIRDAEARVVGAVAVSRDVTELVELDRLKDQFLRVAAHELKTPVAVVMGYAETLSRMATELAPNQRRMLDGLLRGAGRIDRIVADLLFLSQVQLDRLSLVMERVDLGELVDRAAGRARQSAPARRILITRAEPVVLQGDRELLTRVVAHLIDNAIRYSPEGGDVEINLAIAEDREAIVSVRDHGVGIPAGKYAGMFECFYRAHTDTAHDYGGMGTGLYLSRAIVARHGGEMWFESEEGRGSTFHVRLPLTPAGGTAPR